jgi:dihydrolipoamide dehydrogenase
LLKSAQVFEYIKKAEAYGLKIKDFDKDFDAVVKRSRDVASGMSKGVNFLMKKNKIEVINGYGKIKPNKIVSVENDGTEMDFEADNIIIATGGRSRVIDSIPQDGKKIIGYREAMTLQKQPKKMIIVGSGAIGIEFAYFYNSMGTEVKIIEYMDRILPVEDKDISNQLNKTLKNQELRF